MDISYWQSDELFESRQIEANQSSINKLTPCDTQRKGEIQHFLSNNEPFIWYHDDYKYGSKELKHNLEDISKSAYYHTLDYKPYQKYTRKTKNWYRRRSPQEQWVFKNLRYADYGTQVCWDLFHAVKNIMKYLFQLWKGEETSNEKVKNEKLKRAEDSGSSTESSSKLKQKQYSNKSKKKKAKKPKISFGTNHYRRGKVLYLKYTRTHPAIIKNRTPPRRINSESINRINALFNCILLPIDLSEEFQTSFIFDNFKQHRGITSVRILSVLIRLLVFGLDENYSRGYISLHLMISDDLTGLLYPQYSGKDIEKLVLRIAETLSSYEGLFPEWESKFCFHELFDIVNHIRNSGPTRNSWAFPGERHIGIVKSKAEKGGVSFDKTIMNRIIAQERVTMTNAYSFELNDTAHVFDEFRGKKKKLMESLLSKA